MKETRRIQMMIIMRRCYGIYGNFYGKNCWKTWGKLSGDDGEKTWVIVRVSLIILLYCISILLFHMRLTCSSSQRSIASQCFQYGNLYMVRYAYPSSLPALLALLYGFTMQAYYCQFGQLVPVVSLYRDSFHLPPPSSYIHTTFIHNFFLVPAGSWKMTISLA